MEADREIVLNDNEQFVIKTLLDTVKHFDLDLTIRAAGGWVRDKLLQVESNDIDLVVDKMSGEEFAQKVSQFMTDTSQAGCSRIGVVKQNPDQSKHLATACFTLSGIELDVNNLRTETYAAYSRIPQVSIGTASEDAHRRDFTINALFYNLSTGEVEDFVGTGRSDLAAGVIRTPLPPQETFQDDPLRLLRAVRFAARLDFRMDDAIAQSARDPDMAALLFTKVSRERIGIEIDKMLSAGGVKPGKALSLLETMGILGPVFLPSGLQLDSAGAAPVLADLAGGIVVARLVLELLGVQASKQDVRLATYAALLNPWRGLCYKEKGKPRPLTHGILRTGLRLPNELSELVHTIVSVARGFTETHELGDSAERRRRTGEHLRVAKDQWCLSLALSSALAKDDQDQFEARRKWVQDSGLVGCWSWRPFIDGKRLMEVPFSVPKGPRLGSLIEKQIRWRLEDPDFDEAACKRRLIVEAAKG